MNSATCTSEDTIFDEMLVVRETAATGNVYVTEPMPAIKKPVYHQSDEEELHTSFEEAISDRILALQSRLSHLSNPTLEVQYAERNTDAVLSTEAEARNIAVAQGPVHMTYSTDRLECVSRPTVAWRRATAFVCFAMMFMLLGFDLMGFLVLHMH